MCHVYSERPNSRHGSMPQQYCSWTFNMHPTHAHREYALHFKASIVISGEKWVQHTLRSLLQTATTVNRGSSTPEHWFYRLVLIRVPILPIVDIRCTLLHRSQYSNDKMVTTPYCRTKFRLVSKPSLLVSSLHLHAFRC